MNAGGGSWTGQRGGDGIVVPVDYENSWRVANGTHGVNVALRIRAEVFNVL